MNFLEKAAYHLYYKGKHEELTEERRAVKSLVGKNFQNLFHDGGLSTKEMEYLSTCSEWNLFTDERGEQIKRVQKGYPNIEHIREDENPLAGHVATIANNALLRRRGIKPPVFIGQAA